jgi:hypothetical protein
MVALLAVVIGVLMLAWLAVLLAVVVQVGIAAVWAWERLLNRPNRFGGADTEFLRHLGIRL